MEVKIKRLKWLGRAHGFSIVARRGHTKNKMSALGHLKILIIVNWKLQQLCFFLPRSRNMNKHDEYERTRNK